MAPRQTIRCDSCGNEIKLYEGEKLLENTRCRLCGRQLAIPEEFRIHLYKKERAQH
jgi:ribosomal protein S27E